MATIHLGVRLQTEDHQRCVDAAAAAGVSLTEWARTLLLAGLDNNPTHTDNPKPPAPEPHGLCQQCVRKKRMPVSPVEYPVGSLRFIKMCSRCRYTLRRIIRVCEPGEWSNE